jgi:protein SHQ1
LERENVRFDEEYYMADYINDEEIQRLLKFKPESWSALKRIQLASKTTKESSDAASTFSKPPIQPFIQPMELPPEEPQALNMISSNFANILEAATRETLAKMDLGESSSASVATAEADTTAQKQEEEDEKKDATSTATIAPTSTTSSNPLPPPPNPTATSLDPQTLDSYLQLTPSEQSDLLALPRKSYHLVSPSSTQPLLLGLIDILFAYCYDYRTTEAESNVESPWTISKLSATLSAFETFTSLKETLVSCYRRSLAYPLYRHFDLTEKCKEDVTVLFKLGKRALLKSLLGVRRILRGDEGCFVLDVLYVEDYCIWVQGVR